MTTTNDGCATSTERPQLLIDRRAYAAQSHGPDGSWKVRQRGWHEVRGICLHQTACLLGERDERWNSVGCHVGITRSGRVMWLHAFDRIVAHGNGWNVKSVGIEIDGLYAGVEGDPRTVWDDPSTPSRETGMALTAGAADAARQVIRWICQRVLAHAGRVKVLVAHRQSSRDRRNDPGSAIWQEVALPMHKELELGDGGVGFAIGGRPIPEEWDERCKGHRY